MERKGKFTRGPLAEWRSGSDLCVSSVQNHNFVATVGSAIADEPDAACIRADARMIIAAFNAATTCEDMGYDGEACVRALPELVAALANLLVIAGTPITDRQEKIFGDVRITLAKCRG